MFKIPGLFILIIALSSALRAQIVHTNFLVNNSSQNTAGVAHTAIAVASNGNFAVAWQDFNEYDVSVPAMPRVAVQLYSPEGIPIGPLNLFNGETRSAIIYLDDYLTGNIDLEFLPNGTLLVAVMHEGWFDNLVTRTFSWETGIGVISSKGQIVDALVGSGVISWIYAYDLVDNGNLRLEVDPTGGFWGIYNGPSYDTDRSAVLVQKFDGSLNPVGNYFTPHINDLGPNSNHLFSDIAGNGTILMAVWQDGSADPNYDISTQFYKDGGSLGSNQKVNSGDPSGTYNVWPSVSMNANGNSVVVWVDTRSGVGEIYGQRFNVSGQPLGDNFQVSDGDGLIPLLIRPEVAVRNDGSFMVVWTDSLSQIPGAQAYRARARQFDVKGGPTGSPFLLNGRDIPSGQPSIDTNGEHYYCSWLDSRINNVTANVFAMVVGDVVSIPNTLSNPGNQSICTLFQNYPNPFNGSTIIPFSISTTANVVLEIFDISGKKVSILTSKTLQAGEYRYLFDGSKLDKGIYFYRIKVTSILGSNISMFEQTKKIVRLE